MQKPLEPSQPLSYKARLQPSCSQLAGPLPGPATPKGLPKTRTLDQHPEEPQVLGNLEMVFPNTKQSQGVERRRFPASGLPSASPRGSLASTPPLQYPGPHSYRGDPGPAKAELP